jgi:ABC-type uncharacterized transport system permease subunit
MVSLDFNPDRRTLRGFARIWFPLFVVVLGIVLRWRFDAPTAATVTWTAGAALVLAAIASQAVARIVFVALTVVTYPVAVVTSTIVLVVMFFVVITPLGLWLRWRGHDPLGLRARGAASYWQTHEQDDSASRAVRQF